MVSKFLQKHALKIKPHVAYSFELRAKLFSILKENVGPSAREVETVVHFLLDVAGRSEDAIGVKLKHISSIKDYGA